MFCSSAFLRPDQDHDLAGVHILRIPDEKGVPVHLGDTAHLGAEGILIRTGEDRAVQLVDAAGLRRSPRCGAHGLGRRKDRGFLRLEAFDLQQNHSFYSIITPVLRLVKYYKIAKL